MVVSSKLKIFQFWNPNIITFCLFKFQFLEQGLIKMLLHPWHLCIPNLKTRFKMTVQERAGIQRFWFRPNVVATFQRKSVKNNNSKKSTMQALAKSRNTVFPVIRFNRLLNSRNLYLRHGQNKDCFSKNRTIIANDSSLLTTVRANKHLSRTHDCRSLNSCRYFSSKNPFKDQNGRFVIIIF